MPLKITIEAEEPDEPLRVMKLRLVSQRDGSVLVCGKDANGSDWKIAEISDHGIYLSRNIGQSSGWPLDADGRLYLRGTQKA